MNQRDGKVLKLLCRPFFSWRKIHKHFEATTFKDDVNVYLSELVLKLTLKSFFHCPSHLPEAWKTSNSNDFSKPKAFILNILELIRTLLCLELFHYFYIGGTPLHRFFFTFWKCCFLQPPQIFLNQWGAVLCWH